MFEKWHGILVPTEDYREPQDTSNHTTALQSITNLHRKGTVLLVVLSRLVYIQQ